MPLLNANPTQPKQSRRSRIRLRLTPEGVVFVVILTFITISAILRSVNLLIVLAGMMISPLLLTWRSQMHIFKSLRFRRIVPQHIHAGQLLNVQWECINESTRLNAWNILIDDTLEWAGPFETDSNREIKKLRKLNRSQASVQFPVVNSEQSTFASYKTLFANRGHYEIGNAKAYTTFPFGVMKSQIRVGQNQLLVVGPRLGQLSPIWDQRLQAMEAGSDSLKRRRGAEEDEFYALRRWRSGDSRRHIHWRSTAKLGQPMVKQFDQKSDRDLAIVLDLYQPLSEAWKSQKLAMASNMGELDFDDFDSWNVRCETVLSFAATVFSNIAQQIQGQVAFGVCGEESGVLTDRLHHELIVQIMRELAVTRGGSTDKLGHTIVEVANCVSPGTPIYVVSTRPQPEGFTQWGITESERSRVLPSIHWLDVRTPEFEQLFQNQSANNQRDIKDIQTKWAGNEN